MAVSYVPDEFGDTMRLRPIHKNRYLTDVFNPECTEEMSRVSIRDDDVVICAYPKSGMHWLWDQVRMLRAGKVFLDTVDKDSQMMEFLKADQLDLLPSPRIINNHAFFDDQPADLVAGKGKVIYLYRNPKDVAVSWYHHVTKWPSHEYQSSFDRYLRRLVKGIVPFGNPFEYLKTWERGIRENPQMPVHIVRYEDMQTDPVRELERIATFLGCEHDEELLKSIAKATSFESIVESKTKDCLRGRDGTPIMYRKGKVGDWRNHFVVSDSEWFDDVIQRELGDSALYKFVYGLG